MKSGEGERSWEWESVCWSVGLIVMSSLLLIICEKLWLNPRRIRSLLRSQGITGPTPSFPLGNFSQMQPIQSKNGDTVSLSLSVSVSDQWVNSLFPYLQQWRQQYGTLYMYSTGTRQHLYVGNPEFIRELKLKRSLDLGRPSYLSKPLKPMLGVGLIRANGLLWSFQRNLIAPQFFLSKIQNMVDFMEESTREMMSTWERRIAESDDGGTVEIMIDQDLKVVTADVISKACFGSSYAQGNQIFAKLAALQAALSKPSILFGVLNLRFFPTKESKEIWRLKKEVDTLIHKIINDRKQQNQKISDSGAGVSENENQKDLLQIILENVGNDTSSGYWGIMNMMQKHETNKLIVDICKNIYFAGSETTALLATWTLILLALHPEWQQRVRAEILDTYSHMSPHCFRDMEKFPKLKTLRMVIQESLRLYGPAVTTSREALAEMKVGEVVVPKGVNMWFLIPTLHREPEIWGEDAREFKPERFARGVSEACKYPQAYMPFGFGTRICLGQNFAFIEANIILSLLLSRFSFSLSPNYRHCPVYQMLLMPKYGAPILVTKI